MKDFALTFKVVCFLFMATVTYLTYSSYTISKEELNQYILDTKTNTQTEDVKENIAKMSSTLETVEEDFKTIIENRNLEGLKELDYFKDADGEYIKKLYSVNGSVEQLIESVESYVEETNLSLEELNAVVNDADTVEFTEEEIAFTEERLTYEDVINQLEIGTYQSNKGVYELFVIVPIAYKNPSISLKWKKGVLYEAEYKEY